MLHIPPPEQLGLKAQDGAVLHDLPPLVGSSVASTAQRSSDPGHSSRDGDPTLAKVRESGCWALSVVRKDELAAAPAVLDIILVPGEFFARKCSLWGKVGQSGDRDDNGCRAQSRGRDPVRGPACRGSAVL